MPIDTLNTSDDSEKRASALLLKQREFNAAMELYEKAGIYKGVYKSVSVINVSLQGYLVYLIMSLPLSVPVWLFSFAAAYAAADFINGLVHMFMDANDSYDSAAGPLIAAFHLHHKTPVYKKNPFLLVYFNESGSKNWLVGYLLITVLLVGSGAVSAAFAHGLTYFAILSSLAEVSHYCCHVANSRTARVLRSLGLFLSKKHHGLHHLADNVNYAFLNGMSDPLLNMIAKKLSRGYKSTTDLHYGIYTGSGTANR